jgi:anti-sigma-K factor RskA
VSPTRQDRWEILESIGAYAADELESEEAREVERLILEEPDYRRLAESYVEMLALLSTLGNETVEAPEAIVSYAIRRAYVSAFLRRVDQILRGLAGDYLGALVCYLGLRPAESWPPDPEGGFR